MSSPKTGIKLHFCDRFTLCNFRLVFFQQPLSFWYFFTFAPNIAHLTGTPHGVGAGGKVILGWNKSTFTSSTGLKVTYLMGFSLLLLSLKGDSSPIRSPVVTVPELRSPVVTGPHSGHQWWPDRTYGHQWWPGRDTGHQWWSVQNLINQIDKQCCFHITWSLNGKIEWIWSFLNLI